MENIDWFQFRTLASIFIGAYICFELIRLGVRQIIQVTGGRNREQSLYNSANIFSILRVILITFFFVFFILIVVVNRIETTESQNDMGHDASDGAPQSVKVKKMAVD